MFFLSRIIDIPDIVETKHLGNLFHLESYGNSDIEPLITNKHKNDITHIGISEAYFNYKANTAYHIGITPWLQGVITQINQSYIAKIQSINNRGVNADVINKILEILDENTDIEDAYVYGVGQLFIEISPYLKNRNVKIKGLIDAQAKFSTFYLDGYQVQKVEDVDFQNGDTVIVASAVFAIEITNTILASVNKNINLRIINYYNGCLY